MSRHRDIKKYIEDAEEDDYQEQYGEDDDYDEGRFLFLYFYFF